MTVPLKTPVLKAGAAAVEEATRLLHVLEDRVPPEVRDQLKICHRTEGNSIVLFGYRPRYLKPDEWIEHPYAKFTYVAKTGRWKLFWMPSTMRWRTYHGLPEAATFQAAFDELEADPLCCFFG